MYKASYYKNDGTKAGDRDLPIWLFDGIVNEDVLHQAVRAYLLNQRQGSASAKSRSEVRGGSRKPWRQKGTGRARHGTIRSPIWEGGGIAFPPKPKSWRVDLPRKVKALAKRSAFNVRAADGRILVIDALTFEAPKTRQLRELLESVGTDGKVLLLTDGVKKTVYLSGRNLPTVRVMPFGDESAYDVLWASTILIESAAIDSATEEAEARGLDAEAETRIAKAEARAETEEAAPEPEVKKEDQVTEGAATADELAEQEAKAEAAEQRAEEAEKAAAKAEQVAAEAEEASAEAAEREAEAGEAAGPIDVGEIDLPNVKDLPDFLATLENPDTVRALQERDDRKTAQKHYDERIAELTGEEDENG